jgi:hypothetical protein
MAWTKPGYSRRRVDQAGETLMATLASREDRELALVVINNWRSSHSFPLNTLTVNLRKVASDRDREPTVAQRIKRLPSIRHKLERIPAMQLSRMQDIGGCRAVLSSAKAVNQLVDYYKNTSRIKHRLVREYPYIEEPKESGYRGTHLIYRYRSDRSSTWNGLSIELQIRSRLQHAWATAVETVGTFTQQALKSSWGDEAWLRFFALMSSAHALREGTTLVPGTPTDPDELKRELRELVRKLDVVNRLSAYGAAMQVFDHAVSDAKKDTIFLLELHLSDASDADAGISLVLRSYSDAAVAADEYNAIERAIEGERGRDVVLVRVEAVASLRKAYPNYFLDTSAFLDSVHQAIE